MIPLSQDLKTELKAGFQRHLNYSLGRTMDELTPTDAYISLSLSLRDLMMHRLIVKRRRTRKEKRVYYLSMEFLMGKMLNVALVNMNLRREAEEIPAGTRVPARRPAGAGAEMRRSVTVAWEDSPRAFSTAWHTMIIPVSVRDCAMNSASLNNLLKTGRSKNRRMSG
ncbi:MAG: hypothetical protein U1F27_17215 [Turneriella sp.]